MVDTKVDLAHKRKHFVEGWELYEDVAWVPSSSLLYE